MNRIWMIAITAFLLSTQSLPVASQGASDSEIIKTIKEYDTAWDRKDFASVERLLSNQYVYFSSNGKVTSRSETLEFLRSPKYVLQASDRSEFQVYLTNNTAVVSSRWKGHGTYNDQPFTDDQRCSLVLIKDRNNWKLLSEHCTQIAKG